MEESEEISVLPGAVVPPFVATFRNYQCYYCWKLMKPHFLYLNVGTLKSGLNREHLPVGLPKRQRIGEHVPDLGI